MLEFQLNEEALRAEWLPRPDGWECPAGHIRIFRHRALESFAFQSDHAVAFVVRERLGAASCAPHVPPEGQENGRTPPAPIPSLSSDAYRARLAAIRQWPLHYTILEIDRRARPLLRIENSAWPVAPIFLAEHAGGLAGSWDPIDLYPMVRTSGLNFARAAYFLVTFEHYYSAETMFDGMRCLTAGAAASWHGFNGSLTLRYPAPADSQYPRALHAGADVLGTFGSIIDAATQRWLGSRGGGVGSQLSGGLDSAIVAETAGRQTALRTFGLSLPGATAHDQALRRAELITRGGYTDTVFDATETPIFHHQGARMLHHCVVPWEETYYEAFDKLLGLATGAGVDIMLTGFGGDQLLAPHPEERTPEETLAGQTALPFPDFLTESARQSVTEKQALHDIAPESVLDRSTQEELACSSAQFMRHGIWPHHPYATPELVRFCRALPFEWRSKRRLAREYLAARGHSRQVTHPTKSETFSHLFDQSLLDLSRPQFERALRGERLHAAGLVSQDKLSDTYAAFRRGQLSEDGSVQLYAAAILELTLEALDGRATGAQKAI